MRTWRTSAEAETEAKPEQSEEGDEGGEQSGAQDNTQEGEGQPQPESDAMLGAQPEQMEADSAEEEASDSGEQEDVAAEGDDRPGGPPPRRDRELPESGIGYRAYTRLFDEEVEKIVANPARADLGTPETFRQARRIGEAMVQNREFNPV